MCRSALSFRLQINAYLLTIVCLYFVYSGTALVRPEPVDSGRDEFRGPEFRSRKSAVLRKEFPRRRAGQSLLVDVLVMQNNYFTLPFFKYERKVT